MAENLLVDVWNSKTELRYGETKTGDRDQCEKLTSDKVRYLKGIGMDRRLKRDHDVTAQFTYCKGEDILTLCGSFDAVKEARKTIQREPGMFRWYRLPEQELRKLKHAKVGVIIQQLKASRVCIGWAVYLRTSKLFVYSKDAESIEKGLDILLAMVELTRYDIQQPNPYTSKEADSQPKSHKDITHMDSMQPLRPQHNKRTYRYRPGAAETTQRQQTEVNRGTNPILPDTHLAPSGCSQTTERLENIDTEKVAFLRATLTNFVKKTEDELSVNISVDVHKSCITIRGSKQPVSRAIEMAKTHLDNLYIKAVERSSEFINCLSKVKYKEILDAIKRAQVRVGWDIREQKLWLCGDSRPRVNKAEEAICGLIAGGEYPQAGKLTAEQKQSVISAEKWRPYKEQLTANHPTLYIGYNTDSSKIFFALKDKDAFHSILQSLKDFFAPTEASSTTVTLTEDFRNLLTEYKEHVELICVSSDDNLVTLEVAGSTCIVSSLYTASIMNVKTILEAMRDETSSTHMEISWKVQQRWLVTEEGRNRLRDICHKTKTTSSSSDISNTKPPPRPRYPINASYGVQSTTGASTVEPARKIEVVIGDIAAITQTNKVDGVFCSQGATEKSVSRMSSSTRSFQEGLQRIQSTIGSTFVYFRRLPDKSGDNSHLKYLKQEIVSAMKSFAVNRVQTVAFPAVGTGGLKYSAVDVADVMIDGITSYLETNRHTTIQKVYIVVYFDDELCYQEFSRKLGQVSGAMSQPLNAGIQTHQRSAESPAQRLKTSDVKRIRFLGFQSSDVEQAVLSLQQELKKLILEDDWSNSPQKKWIPKLSALQRAQIKEKAEVLDVRVKISTNNIHLEGSQDGIKYMRGVVDQALLQFIESSGKSSLPFTWDLTKMVAGYAEVKLNPQTDAAEYTDVSNAFLQSSGGGIKINEISRIQNEHLYLQYQSQRERVKLEVHDSIVAERSLWHGTDLSTVDKICKSEFNRSFAGRNAVAYGQGSYFATTSEYSMKYATDSKVKYMIMANVVTGRFRLGNSSMTRKDLGEGIHSTVNDTLNPSIFVVYHDAAAYPEYVIKFSKASGMCKQS